VKCTLRQAEIPQCGLFISKRCTGNEGAKNLYLALNQKRYEPRFALPRVIPAMHFREADVSSFNQTRMNEN
jgi:hypothetical protein